MKRYIQSAEGLNSKQRARIAKNSTDPKELRRLAYDNSAVVRKEVAKNSDTPSDAMELLAGDSNEEVRCQVAENPNTTPEVLKLLAEDSSEFVRRYVAENPNTSTEVLKMLSKDPDEWVRKYFTRNWKTPSDENVTQNDKKTSGTRKPPKTDWSIPLYSISNYSEIEDEIDRVIHTAANQVAQQYFGSSARADVDSPEGAYDEDLKITITFHTPDGDEVLEVDASNILGPATSRNLKKDCINQTANWLKRELEV